ncbi:transcriptional regulator [Halorussus salinus]|uniref:transcriptional regulator n=1 Tax=Halorussus salinus TaxID=1364935 RepID=UPI001092043F|nr:winged helix-turn-helix domain-containing protein [Halorussus salinus]
MTDPADGSYEDTYAALTDETRVRILFALAEQYDEAWSSGWLSFSELRERVGVEDTSRFSYHLDELQDTFVRKVDGRYRPRVAALEIVSVIRSGTYDGDAVAVDERETDYECPHCQRALVASYRDHHLYLGCPSHGAAVAYPTPPRAMTDRTLEETIDISLRKHACDVRLFRNGLCPHCWGTAGLSFPRESAPDSYLLDDIAYATAACDTCWVSYPLPVAHAVLGHPAVENLYAERGLGPADAQIGPHDLARVSEVTDCEGKSPAVRLTVSLDDRPLVIELDESCALLDHWRR